MEEKDVGFKEKAKIKKKKIMIQNKKLKPVSPEKTTYQ